MTHHRTLAGLAFTAGRRIEIEDCNRYVAVADQEDAAQHCTTFLDRCAEEAEAARWFLTDNRKPKPQDVALAYLQTHPGWHPSYAIHAGVGCNIHAVRAALTRLTTHGLIQRELRAIGNKPIYYYTALSE